MKRLNAMKERSPPAYRVENKFYEIVCIDNRYIHIYVSGVGYCILVELFLYCLTALLCVHPVGGWRRVCSVVYSSTDYSRAGAHFFVSCESLSSIIHPSLHIKYSWNVNSSLTRKYCNIPQIFTRTRIIFSRR